MVEHEYFDTDTNGDLNNMLSHGNIRNLLFNSRIGGESKSHKISILEILNVEVDYFQKRRRHYFYR